MTKYVSDRHAGFACQPQINLYIQKLMFIGTQFSNLYTTVEIRLSKVEPPRSLLRHTRSLCTLAWQDRCADSVSDLLQVKSRRSLLTHTRSLLTYTRSI